MKNIMKKLAILTITSLPMAVNAQVGTMNIDSYNLSVGETKNIPVMVSENIASADGDITVNDNTCLEILEVNSSFGSGNYFADIDLEGKELANVATIKVKALKECKTNIVIKNASIGSFEANDEERGLTFISGDITVKSNETKKEEANVEKTEVKEEVKQETTKKEEKVEVNEVVEETEELIETLEENKEEKVEENTETESITKRLINLLREILKLFER